MGELFTLVAVLALLIGLNGIFVAAEFAAIGARPTLIQQLAEAGNPVARSVRRLLRDPHLQDAYFATAQVGITLASLGLGMYGEHRLVAGFEPWVGVLGAWAAPAAHVTATVLAVGLLTSLHVVLGEMVPKTVALRHPEAAALRLARPMAVAGAIFRPFVRLFNRCGDVALWLLRLPPSSGNERILSPEELEMVIEESTEGGLMAPHEGQILLSIMDFGEHAVHEIMTPRTRLEAVSLDIGVTDLTARLVTSHHTRFPVYEGDIDHIVGVLHLKDFIRWHLAAATPFALQSLLRPARLVPEQMGVEELLEIFRRERSHLAIVIDEYGGTSGLVSLKDIVEEVVGERRDEFGVEPPPIEAIGPGRLLVRGDVLLETLEAYVDLPNARPDVATVGGLVQTLLGRPAEIGDTVQLGPASFHVQHMDGRAVARVNVTWKLDD